MNTLNDQLQALTRFSIQSYYAMLCNGSGNNITFEEHVKRPYTRQMCACIGKYSVDDPACVCSMNQQRSLFSDEIVRYIKENNINVMEGFDEYKRKDDEIKDMLLNSFDDIFGKARKI